MEYTIRRAVRRPELMGLWESAAWKDAPVAEVGHFHPQSSAHRPRTQVKVLWDEAGLWVHFRVRDRYVRCVAQGFQSKVYQDSCAEFFVQPGGEGGVFQY